MRSGYLLGILMLVALSMLAGAGCSKKSIDSMPPGARSGVSGELSEQELARRRAEEMAMRERELAEKNRLGAGAGSAKEFRGFSDSAVAREMNADLIYFDYDSFELSPDARKILQRKAEIMRANPEIHLVVEGHCDERGTPEYNLALGERRSKAAYDFLVLLGVPAERMRTVSYGEERPACADHSEACFAKNRRDEFKVFE